jgi:hypothetical protein
LHGRISTLYQGRYRSHPVEGDRQLLTAIRYIERKPVRAGLVAPARDWPWSSVGERLGGPGGLFAPLPLCLPDDGPEWLNCAERQLRLAPTLGFRPSTLKRT